MDTITMNEKIDKLNKQSKSDFYELLKLEFKKEIENFEKRENLINKLNTFVRNNKNNIPEILTVIKHGRHIATAIYIEIEEDGIPEIYKYKNKFYEINKIFNNIYTREGGLLKNFDECDERFKVDWIWDTPLPKDCVKLEWN